MVIRSHVNANYMTSDWSDVFALSCTEARLHGFMVNQYNSKVSSKKVKFDGLFIGDAARVKETQTKINKCNLQDKEVVMKVRGVESRSEGGSNRTIK